MKIDLTIATNFFAGYNKYLPKGWTNFATLLIHRQTRHTDVIHKMGQLHAPKEMHIEGGRARQTDRQTDRLILFVIITNANNERLLYGNRNWEQATGNWGHQTDLKEMWQWGKAGTGNHGNGLPDSSPKQTYKQASPQAEPLPAYSLSRTCKSTAATPKKRCLCNEIYIKICKAESVF